jgi:hypothetical protein
MEKNSDPGWKKVGSEIRDKHPESATLAVGHTSGRLPDPEFGFIYSIGSGYGNRIRLVGNKEREWSLSFLTIT